MELSAADHVFMGDEGTLDGDHLVAYEVDKVPDANRLYTALVDPIDLGFAATQRHGLLCPRPVAEEVLAQEHTAATRRAILGLKRKSSTKDTPCCWCVDLDRNAPRSSPHATFRLASRVNTPLGDVVASRWTGASRPHKEEEEEENQHSHFF